MPYIYKELTERHRPHFHPPGATLFLTFRLANSIPQGTLRLYHSEKDWLDGEAMRLPKLRLKDDSPELAAHEERLRQFHRNWFMRFEEILHKAETGPTWLKDERVAALVADALHWRDGRVYRLDTYFIMSNHVHTVFAPHLSESSLRGMQTEAGRVIFESEDPPLDIIMHSLKSWTASQANRLLGRSGQFWEHESYDHVVRGDEEFHRIVNYVLNNPVKAGLVRDWREWRWSWKRE
jgi:REP element-mobilizing transposase RayT